MCCCPCLYLICPCVCICSYLHYACSVDWLSSGLITQSRTIDLPWGLHWETGNDVQLFLLFGLPWSSCSAWIQCWLLCWLELPYLNVKYVPPCLFLSEHWLSVRRMWRMRCVTMSHSPASMFIFNPERSLCVARTLRHNITDTIDVIPPMASECNTRVYGGGLALDITLLCPCGGGCYDCFCTKQTNLSGLSH